MASPFPDLTTNWINGEAVPAKSGESFAKTSPHDGEVLTLVTRSQAEDVDAAVAAARAAQEAWADTPPVARGAILHKICNAIEARTDDFAAIVAAETGKSPAEAAGETGGAVACGRFFAGEGQRLFGRTTQSGSPNKYNMTVRAPCGVAGLIIAANTPIANVAWKVFPALICGNAAVLKAAEDTPATAWLFAEVAKEAGLPDGVLNVIQGLGQEAGSPLVQHPGIDVLSFTGSTAVGKWIAGEAAKRLLKVSLELGGKNPLIVCDDADLDNAAKWTALSAYSNAGQRCAAGSRIIVFESVYEDFKKKLLDVTAKQKVGPTNDDDLGPVINEKQITQMVAAVEKAKEDGATVLAGGHRLTDEAHAKGCYMAPTVIEGADPDAEISCKELFGPIASLYKVKDYAEALALANKSDYGLTACIHTRNIHRAMHFTTKVQAGVAVVNAGTYGSEPHMPFGGVKQSGNGTREPGTEALDIYTELKDLYIIIEPDKI